MEINDINTYNIYDTSYEKVEKPKPIDKPDTSPTEIQKQADLNEIKIEKKQEEVDTTNDIKHSVEYNKELDQQVYLASKQHSIIYQFPTEELLRLKEYLMNK